MIDTRSHLLRSYGADVFGSQAFSINRWRTHENEFEVALLALVDEIGIHMTMRLSHGEGVELVVVFILVDVLDLSEEGWMKKSG